MPKKYQFSKRTVSSVAKPENKSFYFADSGRRLIKSSRKAEDARQEAVSCGYFVYVIDPKKFYREFEEANS